MQLVIIAAGSGSRIREVTQGVPKTLLEVNGKTYKLIRDMQSQIESFSLDDLGGICFNNDLYSIKHENIKTRIYKT